MCLNGCYLELQTIEVVFLYAFNGNNFINSIWAELGLLLDLFFSFIYVFWNITLWDCIKIARVINGKVDFVAIFLVILRYNPHKMEFDNLGSVIQAQYAINLLFEGGFFWCSL